MRNQQAELDERATNALLRKIDLRLLPLLVLLNIFSYLIELIYVIKESRVRLCILEMHFCFIFVKGMHSILDLYMI